MTTRFSPNPALLADYYKLSHREQYPMGTEYIYSTWIPRKSYIPQIDSVVAFGFQAFIERWLIKYFNDEFFNADIDELARGYERFVRLTLGVETNADHLRYLHSLGYLPLKIMAVPEGLSVPIRVPMLTIENTDPKCFWLTNYIETLFSNECWMASTSATIAREYRRILNMFEERTVGPVDPSESLVPFQGHDFSMRGMSGIEAAAMSGAGHLLSFVGTDTIPAIEFLIAYYGADIEREMVGTSIPATEHSVMCAHGKNELEAYRYFISDLYPNGLVSIVSDTWDLWSVLTNVIAELKDVILARDGRLVIRPDSGDPVNIICGDPSSDHKWAQRGVIDILWEIFGGTHTPQGYKQLDSHIGCIYGDSITLTRCQEICERLERQGFASTNMVYGVGSYTYQYQTRDTFGFALKSTWAQINGVENNIFKDPITDSGMKKSLTGRVVVSRDPETNIISAVDGLSKYQEQSFGNNLLRPIFVDGLPQNIDNLSTIRGRIL